MFKKLPLYIFLLLTLHSFQLFAQPSTIPAAGHEWTLVSAESYTSGPVSTQGANGDNTIDCGAGANVTTCGANDTSFGWDIQCLNTPSTVMGLPGANFVQAQAFGNIGTNNNLELIAVPCNPGVGGTNTNENWPQTTEETRVITLTNWDNMFPDAALMDGVTEGTVWLPVSASLNFLDDGIGDGTGAGADELKFLVIGGNNGQCSSWEITAEYDLSINAGPYASIVGTEEKVDESISQSLSNVPDAGSGNTYHATDDVLHSSGCGNFQGTSWYFPGGTNTGSFGTGFAQSFDILSMLLEDNSPFNIEFTSTQNIALNRTNGNSDAKVTMGPGMGGKAELIVQYQIWEILAPLPVELTDFTVTRKSQQASLNWSTHTEINSDYFIIQRSTDGTTWLDLAQIYTGADSEELKHYNYLDSQPNQKNYYRLKQVDNNQAIAYSEIKSISFENIKPQILITPNPFSTHLTISAKADTWDIVEIIDQTGQVILQSQSETPNIQHLTQGLYFCIFKKENGMIVDSQKLIKTNHQR